MEYPVAVPHEPLALLPAAATAGTILSIVRLGITAHLFLALLVVSICQPWLYPQKVQSRAVTLLGERPTGQKRTQRAASLILGQPPRVRSTSPV